MKITMEQLAAGEEEIIIRYKRMDERIEALCRFIKGQEGRLMGSRADSGGQLCLFFPGEVLQ